MKEDEEIIMKKIGIHNGTFHADDVFCIALMQSLYGEVEVIRTRDQKLLDECDIVADVGNGKYDHHDVEKKLRENGIPYCAFGLLWQDFGVEYVKTQFPSVTDENEQKEIADKIDNNFIQQIDANDNGVDVMQSEVPITTLSEIIKSYVPFCGTEEDVEKSFFEAVDFAKMILFRKTKKYAEHYNNLRLIQAEIEKQDVDNTHMLVLENSVPWKDAVLEFDKEEKILFVVYPNITGSWCVQTTLKDKDSFAARKDLPKSWGGLRDDDLSRETGINDCVFCHPALFICGNKRKEGAIKMAQAAVLN